MTKKICTNFGKCVLADNHEDFSHEKTVMRFCPLCDKSLSEIKVSSPKKVNSILSDVILAVVLIFLFEIAVGKDWIKTPEGTNAAELRETQNEILRLAGSDIVGDRLGPALAEAFFKTQGATNLQIVSGSTPQEKTVRGLLPGDTVPSAIEIAAYDSASAFSDLANETCDIGMASRRIKPDEVAKLATLGNMTSAGSEHILGLDGIAVIVNASNRIAELRKDEIKRIFTGDITDWSQVGSAPGTISLYVRDNHSGDFDAFKTLVLAGKPISSSARQFEDSNALSEAVSSDPNAIGFVSMPYIHTAKSVAISDRGTNALKPTLLTVATEDYPLSRRLYLYTPATARNKFIHMFVEFALSKQGQEVVAATGFASQNLVPVSQSVLISAPDDYKQLTQGAERLPVDFRFPDGESAQDNKAQADLDRIASLIADQASAGERVLLFGFGDNSGTPDESQTQSLNRAKTVESQLVQRGIKPAAVRGFGSEYPVASNDTSDGREMNRRVEIWIKKQ